MDRPREPESERPGHASRETPTSAPSEPFVTSSIGSEPPSPPPAPPFGIPYPVRFWVDYPEDPRNRLTVFFRWILVIPIAMLLGLLTGGGLTGGSYNYGYNSSSTPPEDVRAMVETVIGSGGAEQAAFFEMLANPILAFVIFAVLLWFVMLAIAWVRAAGISALLVFPLVAMLLFRGKYPAWWFTWNLELSRFAERVWSYSAALRDEYPSTDEEQSVHLEIDQPDGKYLSGILTLFKWLLAIPHYWVIALLELGAGVAMFIGWWAVMLAGTFPRALFDYVVAVRAWELRVSGYAFLLVTDQYPPFRLGTSRSTAILLMLIGFMLMVVFALLFALLFTTLLVLLADWIRASGGLFEALDTPLPLGTPVPGRGGFR